MSTTDRATLLRRAYASHKAPLSPEDQYAFGVGVRAGIDAALASLDARLPATTPQDPVGAPVAGAGRESGSVGGGAENGAHAATWRLVTHPGELQEGQSVLFDAGGSPKTGYLKDDSNVLATEDWEVVRFADDGEPTWAEGITNVHVRAPLPVAQDGEAIVKRRDLANLLNFTGIALPPSVQSDTLDRLRAALDRGQGA